MPSLYNDASLDARDDIAATLAGRQMPWQASLGEIGKPFAAGSQPKFGGALNTAQGAVPPIGMAGSIVPVPRAQTGMLGAMPTLGAMGEMPQMPGVQQRGQRRRY